MSRKRKKQHFIATIVIATIFIVIAACMFSLRMQKMTNDEKQTIYIPDGSDYQSVVDSLTAHGCLVNTSSFNKLSRLRNYNNHVKGGCYKIEPHANMWKTLTKLYYGNQDAVRITVRKARTLQQLCSQITMKLEMDSSSLYKLLSNDSVCAQYNQNRNTIIGIFIQNTYDIYWNITPEKLLDRMNKEYERFWNNGRMQKCRALNLTEMEVITLASIVDEESNKNDEKANIASVYLNRLRKGMLLQADPTLKFAAGDFTLRRVLDKHKENDSPYNTYKYRGLPPGPICMPSITSIDAVLENKKTDYLYFCAKSDFSGYHAFASSLEQHNANAKQFHKALNRRKIYK